MSRKSVPPERLAEQQALKDICNRVRKREKVTWPQFWSDYIGIQVGLGYEKNLGDGQVSCDRVSVIRDWIIAHELDIAAAQYPQYFTRDLRTDWQGFVQERGSYGTLHTVPFKPMTLHEISAQHPMNPIRIKLGEQFTVELDSPIYGSVIALDYYKNKWYPIPLHEDGSFTPIPITNGLYGFPIKDHDTKQIIPMRQRSYAGEHGHCFIIGPDQLLNHYTKRFAAGKAMPLSFLNEMAKRFSEIEDYKLSIHLENVIFE